MAARSRSRVEKLEATLGLQKDQQWPAVLVVPSLRENETEDQAWSRFYGELDPPRSVLRVFLKRFDDAPDAEDDARLVRTWWPHLTADARKFVVWRPPETVAGALRGDEVRS